MFKSSDRVLCINTTETGDIFTHHGICTVDSVHGDFLKIAGLPGGYAANRFVRVYERKVSGTGDCVIYTSGHNKLSRTKMYEVEQIIESGGISLKGVSGIFKVSDFVVIDPDTYDPSVASENLEYGPIILNKQKIQEMLKHISKNNGVYHLYYGLDKHNPEIEFIADKRNDEFKSGDLVKIDNSTSSVNGCKAVIVTQNVQYVWATIVEGQSQGHTLAFQAKDYNFTKI